MHYLALACDYDGTLAKDGQVSQNTITALERVVASGRKLILVTGRLLPDLQQAFLRLDLFSYVVAENGALLYQLATKEEKVLGEAPSAAFIQALHDRGVVPLSIGQVIVATWHPYETAVLEVIRELGLERQVIFNKGAVMVLPTGVNKGTGLAAAVQELNYSSHNLVGIGDAENDHSFLALCEYSMAVANALPALKEQVDCTTNADHGDGVIELIEHLVNNDLQDLDQQTSKHSLVLGTTGQDEQIFINAHRNHILI
jgi:HAD superfamily hydrolase (TIGR01484 family)